MCTLYVLHQLGPMTAYIIYMQHTCMYAHKHLCMYACMYVHMNVRMYILMHGRQLERKEKREKMAAEGLEPRVYGCSHHNHCATSRHSNQPLSVLLSYSLVCMYAHTQTPHLKDEHLRLAVEMTYTCAPNP